MDLGGLDLRAAASRGEEFELLHPGTGEPTGVHLRVVGYDCAEVEDAARAASRAMMRGSKKPDPVEAVRARRVAMASAAIKGVRGGSGGTTTADEVRALLSDPGFVWIVEQIEAFAGDRASFFTSAETP